MLVGCGLAVCFLCCWWMGCVSIRLGKVIWESCESTIRSLAPWVVTRVLWISLMKATTDEPWHFAKNGSHKFPYDARGRGPTYCPASCNLALLWVDNMLVLVGGCFEAYQTLQLPNKTISRCSSLRVNLSGLHLSPFLVYSVHPKFSSQIFAPVRQQVWIARLSLRQETASRQSHA